MSLISLPWRQKNRSSRPEVFCEKGVFFEILQNSQENSYVRASFLIKLQV